MASPSLEPIDPGHSYADTKHVSFKLHKQAKSAAPYGYEYFLSLPPSYDEDPQKQWPLILFLHGAGESQGGPGESYACLRHGIPKIILCYDKLRGGDPAPSVDIPFAPRFRDVHPNKGRDRADADLSTTPVPPAVCKAVAENFVTVTPIHDWNNGFGWNAPALTSLLDEVLSSRPLQGRVDLARLHLTGFSMGGYGTWDLALHTPARFATLSPICGGGDEARAAAHLRHTPQWVFHGEKDDVVPLKNSEAMVNALKQAGASQVRLTTYPDTGHDSWTAAYKDIELWEWMLKTKNTQHGEEEVLPPEDKAAVV